MFWKKKTEYMEWNSYKEVCNTWDTIAFAQKSRNEYVKNMPSFAEQNI